LEKRIVNDCNQLIGGFDFLKLADEFMYVLDLL
jgi:hypothetical protein